MRKSKRGDDKKRVTYVEDVPGDRKADGKADDVTPDRWFSASKETVASKVTAQAKSIEAANWNTSGYMQFVCARYLTGRNPGGGFGYSMSARSGRAATNMATAEYGAPSLNCIGVCADVYQNKVFKNQPWLVYMPTVKGSWEDRQQCKAMGQFVDAAFDQLKIFADTQLCGTDAMMYPSAFYGVGPSLDGKTIKGERILSQEILLTAGDSGSYNRPTSAIRRAFCNRRALVHAYARGPNAESIKIAIMKAPGVFAGYIPAAVDYDEIVAVSAAYSLPLDDETPGRYVLAVGDAALEDKPWTRKRFPWAKFEFQVLSNEYMGQSLTEICLKLQRNVDSCEEAIGEMRRRNAWTRWLIESSSNVNTDQFAGPGFVDYTGTAPVQVEGEIPKVLIEERDASVAKVFSRARISQGAASGEKPEGLSSGLSILAWNQIDDSAHVDLAQRYEQFIKDIGDLIIEACADIKPSFMVDGHKVIKWEDAWKDTNRFKTTAFPLSRLPQTISGKLQQIDTWYMNGTITREQKLRLEGMPDLQGFVDLETASSEWVSKTLDTVIGDHYVPPLPYINSQQALKDAQARYLLESNWETEPKRLMRLTKFISALKEQAALQPALTPATQPAGMQSPQAAQIQQ